MAKVVKHVITGVWYNSSGNTNKHITHFMIHDVNERNIKPGNVYPLKKAVEMIESLLTTNFICVTASWSYSSSIWNFNNSAIVEIEEVDKVKYLRTHRDSAISDNLSNMIHMSIIPIKSV